MERSVREGRHNRQRLRMYGEGVEDKDAWRKEDRKRRDNNFRQKGPSGSQPRNGSTGHTSSSGFHRQKDIPPRFQTHNNKSSKYKYSTSRTATAGGKKETKDPTTNCWHQNPPISSMHSSSQTTTTRNRHMDDDGGWSRGSPAKGSGWSSKKNHTMPARDTKAGNQVALVRDFRGSPEVDSAAVWPMPEHKHQGSSGSGEGDGWNTFSPGQSNSSRQHSQSENWMSDEGSLSMGENACSPQSNSSPSPSNVGWNIGPDVPDVQHELEPIEDDELEREGSVEVARTTPGSEVETGFKSKSREDERKRKSNSWDDLDAMPSSTTDKDMLAQTTSKHPPAPSLSSDEQYHKHTSCSPSMDMDKTLESADTESTVTCTSTDKDIHKRYEEISAGVHVPHTHTTSGTPDGLGMSVWKSRASVGGSTSSINSVGSSSSWKSEGKNGYHSKPSNFSPRKSSRYDSQSSTGSGAKVRKMKKVSSGLDDALESLHSEPSGWGDLPSPKPTDVDNGTEIWGVAPDDLHRKSKTTNSWGDCGGGGVGKMGGGILGGGGAGGGDWGDDSVGAMTAGWPGAGDTRSRTVGRVGTPGTLGSQWMPPKQDSWGKKSKQHNFPENVSKLMDMGFSHHMAEKYLKSNGNDLDATIGDLLAVGVITDDGSLNGSRISKKPPGKPFPGANHLFGGSGGSNSFSTTPSSMGPPGTPGANLGHKDLYQQQQQQQLIPNSLSTLTQPMPSGVGTQAQQMQALQMQQHMQMPNATVLSYQQMLSQQLSQLKIAKQQVTQQLRQVSAMSGQGSGSSMQQQIQTRLNLINQFISHINQQLMLQKYSSQQKDKPGMMEGGSSVTPGAVGSQPIGRGNPTSRNKDMKLSGPIPSRSMSVPGGAHEHNLALGMQGLNMNGHVTPSSISQSSARSVSRLQQIISGSSSDTLQHNPEDKTKFRFPPVQSASIPAEIYSSTSSPLASSGSSTTTTTPASTPFSPARSFTDIQEFRPGVPWQPRTLPTEPAQLYAKPVPPQQPELRTAQSEPSFPHYNLPPGMRPHRRPPSLGYNPPVGNMAPGSFRGRDQQSGWPTGGIGRGSTSSPMTNSPFGTPDTAFPPNAATYGGRTRPQNQMKFDGTEELGPPLTRPNALFPNHNTSQAPGRPSSLSSSTSSDTGRWGSSQGFPNSRSSSSSSAHPPSSLTSSVWESSSAGGNPSWNLGSLDTDGQSYPTPASATVPSFTSPPNTSSDEVTSGLSGAWDKGGFHSSSVLSPEPSFEEWQAGKKAHLSVFKLPSNAPTPWLCIQNVSSQVDEASLRDVCSEFGLVESVSLHPDTETAVVQFSSKDQAMQAKAGLDKSPVICGVSVAVDFMSDDQVSNLIIQQQQRASGQGNMQHSKWPTQNNPAPQPGNSGLVNGSHWDSIGQPRTNSNGSNSDRSVDTTIATTTLWSGNSFLSGISSPWSNRPPATENAPFPSSTGIGKHEPPTISSSPSLSTYLPNGLF